MNIKLLKHRQVDLVFGWPFGKAKEMAKQGKLKSITLPDGTIRFREQDILSIIHPEAANRIAQKLVEGKLNGGEEAEA